MVDPTQLLLVHAAATWALVGLIWTIQLVQYPGFQRIGRTSFAAFHEHHCASITWIVAPLMGLEGVTAAGLWLWRPEHLDTGSLVLGTVLLSVNWITTAALFVPLHGRLRPDAKLDLRRLVTWNWIRTLAWSARGVWVLAVLWNALGPAEAAA